jgi:hypothetical protein
MFFISTLAAIAASVPAKAEPVKPPPPKETLAPDVVSVRPQVQALREDPPTEKPLPPGEQQEAACVSGTQSARVVNEKPVVEAAPTTEATNLRTNRILLVDLGERELKERQSLKSRDSRNSAKSRATKCR